MAKKTPQSSDGIRLEIETVQRVVKAAQKNLTTVERALNTLRQRENKAAARLRDLQKRAAKDAKLRSSKGYLRARDSLKTIAEARRRNERLVKQQRKDVADKIRRLRALERQARTFGRDLTTFHRRAESSAPRATIGAVTGEQLRGARAMLNRGQAPFAKELGISVAKLKRFEKTAGPLVDEPDVIKGVFRGLQRMGVELIDTGMYVGNGGPGLRLRPRRARANVAGPKKKTWTAKKRRKQRSTRAA